MAEISRSQTLRNNERLKHFAGFLTALANALVIGGFGKMTAVGEFSIGASLAVFIGFVVVWISSVLLTMLQAEGEI